MREEKALKGSKKQLLKDSFLWLFSFRSSFLWLFHLRVSCSNAALRGMALQSASAGLWPSGILSLLRAAMQVPS